jgi:hypothetical protein
MIVPVFVVAFRTLIKIFADSAGEPGTYDRFGIVARVTEVSIVYIQALILPLA